MKKRGQITLFIIIGIVLLLMAGVFFYLYKGSFEIDNRNIPDELVPFIRYVDGCVSETAQAAVSLLGSQGGYITLPERISYNPLSYVQLIPRSPFKTPYWYYRGESRVPSIAGMETDISRYTEKNLKSCLSGYSAFQGQFAIQEAGAIKAKASIAKNEVIIKVDYPLEITDIARGSKTVYKDYYASIDVKLKRAYELATELMKAENEQQFLEQATVNLMVLNPDIPFTDVFFSCGRKTWHVADVAASLKETLFWNMPRIRVQKTDYRPFRQPLADYQKYDKYDKKGLEDLDSFADLPLDDKLPEDIYEYKQLFWDALKKDYSDLNVALRYDKSWPLGLVARPSSNGKMSSSQGKGSAKFLKFICVNTYHFTYDAEFPVEIIITDEKAFQNEGFTFRFITPVYIGHNQGSRNTFAIASYPIKDRNPEFCESSSERQLSITVRDALWDTELPSGVNISYECGPFVCDLGPTKLDAPYIRLLTKLPEGCQPGIVTAESHGYLKGSTELGADDTRAVIKLIPLISLDWEIKKQKDNALGNMLALAENQQAIVQLTNDTFGFELSKSYPDDKGGLIQLPYAAMDLDISIYLMEGSTIVGAYEGVWHTEPEMLLGKTKVTLPVIEPAGGIATNEQLGSFLLDLEKYKASPELE